MSQNKPGLVLEMRVGESVSLSALKNFCGDVDSDKIVLILESKDGQRARVRIQAPRSVRIGQPEPHPA